MAAVTQPEEGKKPSKYMHCDDAENRVAVAVLVPFTEPWGRNRFCGQLYLTTPERAEELEASGRVEVLGRF